MNEQESRKDGLSQNVSYWLDRVREHPENLKSKLWWADAIRNAVIAHNIKTLYANNRVVILDVPCGISPIAEFLVAEDLNFYYVGIDPDGDSNQAAWKRTQDLKSNCRKFSFRQECWKLHESEKEKYNVILCLDGPEHLVDSTEGLQKLFKDFHYMLKLHGTLFISTPRAREDRELHYPYCHDVEFTPTEVIDAMGEYFQMTYHAGYRIALENMDEDELFRPEQDTGLDPDDFIAIPHHVLAPFIVWAHPEVADSILYVCKKI